MFGLRYRVAGGEGTMNAKDHDAVQKRKAALPSKTAANAKSPVPAAGVKLQQGTTADMQHNVGNSGLKDLLAEQKPASAAKDPARMGADALRAQAKADASALAKKSGKLAGPASRGGGMEPDEKQKSVLDADASRKKQEVESARKKAQEEEAKPAKGRDRVAVRAEVAPPAAAEEQPAKKSVPLKSAKKPALAKAVVAKEAEAEHAKAKVDLAKSFVGRKHDEVADSSRVASAKLAESGKRAAVQTSSLVDAEAKVEAEEVRHAVQAAPKPPKAVRAKASVPSVEGPGGRAALTVRPKAEGKEAKGAPAEDKANARREAHVKKVELAGEAKIVAEGRVEQVKGRKVAVEAKAAAEPDVAKKASHAKAAASEAEAERAANETVKAKAREVDQLEIRQDSDKGIDEVARAADLDAHDGGQVTLVGVYVPRPSEAGGPQLGHVSVMVGDQEVRLGNEVRGTAEILRLSGERVLITGKLDLKKQPGQALDPSRREKPVLTGFRAPHTR